MIYWLMKYVLLGPLLRAVWRPWTEGRENVPDEGPAILASNHLAFCDSFFMPLLVGRKVTFLAKAEYFTTPGLKGLFSRVFFSGVGQVPIDRDDTDAARAALTTGVRVLAGGNAARHLPRGHPLTGWPALPRQDRRRPDGAGVRSRRRPLRHDQHRDHPTPRPGAAAVAATAGCALRQAAGLLALRGDGRRPARRTLDDRRDHVRADAAFRPGVRRPVRGRGEEGEGAQHRLRRTASAGTAPTGCPTPRRPDAPAVRYFYDCEFIEDGTTIDLVSIGVVDENGREFYAVSTDFDPAPAIDWVRRNVLDKLPSPADPAWRPREQIRADLLAFLTRAGRADRAVGVDGRLRPRGALPAVGRHARRCRGCCRASATSCGSGGRTPASRRCRRPQQTSTTRSPTPATTWLRWRAISAGTGNA